MMMGTREIASGERAFSVLFYYTLLLFSGLAEAFSRSFAPPRKPKSVILYRLVRDHAQRLLVVLHAHCVCLGVYIVYTDASEYCSIGSLSWFRFCYYFILCASFGLFIRLFASSSNLFFWRLFNRPSMRHLLSVASAISNANIDTQIDLKTAHN